MSDLKDFIGGNTSLLLENLGVANSAETAIFMEKSGNVIPNKSGKYLMLLSGGGGAGGSAPYSNGVANGGASGFLTVSEITLVAGQTYPFIAGAGGIGAIAAAGTNGGQSSFNGLTANGGEASAVVADIATGTTGIGNGYIPTTEIVKDTVSTFIYTAPDAPRRVIPSGVLQERNIGSNGALTYGLFGGSSTPSILADGGGAVGNGPGGAGKYGSGGGVSNYGYTSGHGGDGFLLLIFIG